MSQVTLLILIFIVLALLLRLDFVFYIVYVVAAIYFLSRWLTPRAFRGLKMERRFAGRAFLGERVDVTLRLHNRGRLPLPWLQADESVAPELAGGAAPRFAVALRGRESRDFHYRVQATRRGYYRLGPLTVRGGDFFGWAELRAQAPASYLTVYPRITPLAKLGLPSRLPFGTIAGQRRHFEDPARPVGVRDYHRGDSLRLINWKVSAHGDNLVVKTLQPAISLDTYILLNLNRDDFSAATCYSAPEWAIEIAASLAAHLSEQQQAVGLATNGRDLLQLLWQGQAGDEEAPFDPVTGRLLPPEGALSEEQQQAAPAPPRRGRAQLMKVLELLARVEPMPTAPFAGWIPQATLHLSWGVTVPVITPQASDEVVQALHRLVRAGFSPVLIVTTPLLHFGRVQAQARQLGYSAYNVAAPADLDVWRQPRFTWAP